MCGITGFWQFNQSRCDAGVLRHTVNAMAFEMHTRGPDAQGSWVDVSEQIALGHRRLAIVELSKAGSQPMICSDHRWVLVYNGEIYNAKALKQALQALGCVFKGHSDTEVLLQACRVWGVESACQKCIGMFAFALWDSQEKRLFLVRDRLGIKPLYYGFHNQIFFFGSQLKSFYPHTKFYPEISKQALALYFKFNYVPAPYSIYEGIFKLNPGEMLILNRDKIVEKKTYWSLAECVENGQCVQSSYQPNSPNDWVDKLESLLKDAVEGRLVAEVPLGAFLSGGIDSSLVVALMQSLSKQPVKTFSIGFLESAYNEACYAKAVAAHLGCEHHELYLTPQQVQSIIPNLPIWYDEPFADVSQIPTYLVSKLAKDHVSVVLSGDGGDELFAGYNRYWTSQLLWSQFGWMPFWLKLSIAKSIQFFSETFWDKIGQVLPGGFFSGSIGHKAYKLSELLASKNSEIFYDKMISVWPEDLEIVKNHTLDCARLKKPIPNCLEKKLIEKMQYQDLLQYLPDDILTKVDRASMAVGLEARVPLLDHRLVEFAWQLPLEAKLKNKQTKWLLRQVLSRYVPEKLINRPKMGFGVPIGAWLRNDLKSWAVDLLSSDLLNAQGILQAKPIHTRLKAHLAGEHNWQSMLWGVLMFQAWFLHHKTLHTKKVTIGACV